MFLGFRVFWGLGVQGLGFFVVSECFCLPLAALCGSLGCRASDVLGGASWVCKGFVWEGCGRGRFVGL